MGSKGKNRTASPLRCCHSASSLTSASTSSNNGDDICEALNIFIGKNKSKEIDPFLEKKHFPRRPPADVCFENITYTASNLDFMHMQKEYKKILHGVSGEFRSGELSAIMGPSGAGKTTLLNILAGFTTIGSTGMVKINDNLRENSARFRKLTAYIPQDEEIRLNLTVMESMTVAAHLKLGYEVSNEYKQLQSTELLELLGLEECHNTLASRLSGGQRKRLAIALELLSNPPIIFLDEPTTGLDSSSCTQCVSLLKRLAQDGRTVICTIHQPSALIFEMIDNLYAVASGRCIYQGPTCSVVPHFAKFGIQCPSYHNPADFLMEVATDQYDCDMKILWESPNAPALSALSESARKKEKEILASSFVGRSIEDIVEESSPTPASVCMQFWLLYKRNLLGARRNYMYLLNRLLAHIFIGFVFGYLYKGVGSRANTILANYVYLYGTLLLIVYTGKMSVTLSFPLEMKILTREHFNRWYKLTPYLLSVILMEIPFQVMCAWSYIAISYWLTDQPIDFRLYWFVVFCTLSTLCAQAWGYFIGATTPIKIAVFIGPVIACLFSVFGFCIRYFDTPIVFRWMFHVSYYRAGFQGIVYAMYGWDRTDLMCPDDLYYCHYKQPMKFLKEMGIVDVNIVSNVSLIIVISCIMHALTYITIWLKLHKR